MSEERTVVIRLTSQLKRQLVLVLILLLLILAVIFYLGTLRGMGQAVDLSGRVHDLSQQTNQQAMQLKSHRAQQVVIEKAAEIDRLAAESVRKDLLMHQKQVAELQRDVEFYRGLMAPDEMQRGFKLHTLDVTFDSLTERYNFKGVMTNAGGNGNVVKGDLSLALEVYEEGTSKQYKLSDLPDYTGKMPIKMRFRFFQNIQGSFTLPEGMKPVSLIATANIKDITGNLFKASYDWGVLNKTHSLGEH